MVIESYKVDTAAQRSYVKVEHEQTQMAVWGGGVNKQTSMERQAVYAEFSETAQQMLASGQDSTAPEQAAVQNKAVNAPKELRPDVRNPYALKLEMLQHFIYQLTGRRIKVYVADELFQPQRPAPAVVNLANISAAGGEMRYEKTTFESEAVSFAATGTVKTADGKNINIEMQLKMSRSFYQSTSASLQWGNKGQLCDPLVINYGGTAASLTQRKFAFDLDCDGSLNQISFAGAGSGFLALDKNGDGTINDGSELFGPQSGNGFADLREHDKDSNGWIDEADDVFSKLVVWSKDENGNDQYFTLKELGIGAIYLGETETQFQMNDAAGQMQGQMRSTSFYLKENGGAGYLHHIDLLA